MNWRDTKSFEFLRQKLPLWLSFVITRKNVIFFNWKYKYWFYPRLFILKCKKTNVLGNGNPFIKRNPKATASDYCSGLNCFIIQHLGELTNSKDYPEFCCLILNNWGVLQCINPTSVKEKTLKAQTTNDYNWS